MLVARTRRPGRRADLSGYVAARRPRPAGPRTERPPPPLPAPAHGRAAHHRARRSAHGEQGDRAGDRRARHHAGRRPLVVDDGLGHELAARRDDALAGQPERHLRIRLEASRRSHRRRGLLRQALPAQPAHHQQVVGRERRRPHAHRHHPGDRHRDRRGRGDGRRPHEERQGQGAPRSSSCSPTATTT